MRELIKEEITTVSGGDLECTIGTGGINCTGTLIEFADEIFGAYDNAVSSFTDFYEWIDLTLFDGWE